MSALRFTTTLQPRGPAAAVVLSDEQVAELGEGSKAFAVSATVNGHTWPGRVSRMHGENLVGMSRAVREAAGVEAGDAVAVELVLETAPPEVQVPATLTAALDGDPPSRAAFDALAPSHRKEFARWVAEAKRDETRERRVAQTLEMLREGRTR